MMAATTVVLAVVLPVAEDRGERGHPTTTDVPSAAKVTVIAEVAEMWAGGVLGGGCEAGTGCSGRGGGDRQSNPPGRPL